MGDPRSSPSPQPMPLGGMRSPRGLQVSPLPSTRCRGHFSELTLQGTTENAEKGTSEQNTTSENTCPELATRLAEQAAGAVPTCWGRRAGGCPLIRLSLDSAARGGGSPQKWVMAYVSAHGGARYNNST